MVVVAPLFWLENAGRWALSHTGAVFLIRPIWGYLEFQFFKVQKSSFVYTLYRSVIGFLLFLFLDETEVYPMAGFLSFSIDHFVR